MNQEPSHWPSREAMSWSADALEAIEIVRGKFGEVLQGRALEKARQDGRNLVTDEDVLAVLENMAVMADLDQETAQQGVVGR